MSSDERKKRREERAQKLRLKQEAALKKANEDEMKANEATAEAQRKAAVPEEMSAKGYNITAEELSNGQFSTVFKAKYNDEDIAVRIIEKEGKEDNFVKRLVPRFVRILRILDERHPNIVSTLDVFETSKRILIPMRLTPNGSLYDFIDKQTDPMKEDLCRQWSQQVMSAVTYLHINGIVHRDLRSERILLDENNSLKITGFTFSRLWMNAKDNSKSLANTCVGTGPYCSPESLTGESYDPRTADVWAFGVIVFYIWNKSYPFDYSLTHKLLSQTRNKEWVNRMRKDSNDAIKAFFEKTFDVNHSKRQTIIDLLKDKWIDSKLTVDLKSTSTEGQKTNTEPQKAKEVPKNSNKKVEDKKTKKEDKKQKEESEDDDNDVVDVSDDDDEDESGKGWSSASKPTNGKLKENQKSPEKPKTNVSVPKRSSSDDNVLRTDILDELKKEFLSIQ